MRKHRKAPLDSQYISATELAKMGLCEKLVVLEDIYGRRAPAHRRQARQRGLMEHKNFYREGLRSTSEPDERAWPCSFISGSFIAMNLYAALDRCLELAQSIQRLLPSIARRTRKWITRDGGDS